MSDQPKCETCRWLGNRSKYADAGINDDGGFQCRRRSPVATGGMMSAANTMWPLVTLDDWCGEHSPREQEKT